jgi:hypothetical protein
MPQAVGADQGTEPSCDAMPPAPVSGPTLRKKKLVSQGLAHRTLSIITIYGLSLAPPQHPPTSLKFPSASSQIPFKFPTKFPSTSAQLPLNFPSTSPQLPLNFPSASSLHPPINRPSYQPTTNYTCATGYCDAKDHQKRISL